MPTLTGFKKDAKGLYIEKDPYATLDYTLDWTNWMPSGYTIASLTVTGSNVNDDSSSLSIDSSSHSNYWQQQLYQVEKQETCTMLNTELP